MKVVPFEGEWKKDHPTGAIAFHHLLKGEPGSPDNYMYILGRQDADFHMPRHRHNFDQIRFPLIGAMNHGHGLVLEEGHVAYIPEGLPYGPQDDPLGEYAAGERVQLVLQFGGASGYGFMSIEQRRQAWKELEQSGKFVGPYYHRNDGTSAWGLNAIWEHVFGQHIRYPRSRYQQMIIADPARFNWLPVDGAAGVERKFVGAFSERGVWVEFVRLRPQAEWVSADPHATRLLVVLSGEGTANDEPTATYSAVEATPDDTLRVRAQSEMEFFLVGLPPVRLPQVASEHYDLEELPGEPVPA